MRKFLALVVASTFLTVTPVIPQPVQAGSLFESLFPRAAERRRKRVQRRQFRRQLELDRLFDRERATQRKRRKVVPLAKAKIKGPGFKTYFATPLKPVRLVKLAKAFSAYDQKLLAADALRQEKPLMGDDANSEVNSEVSNGINNDAIDGVSEGEFPLTTGDIGQKPKLISDTPIVVEEEVSPLAAVRLSAGHGLLNTISLMAPKSMGKSLVQYYAGKPEFIWLDGEGKPNQKAALVLGVLADADAYGLRADDYALPLLSVGAEATEEDNLRAAMQFEFSMSAAVLQYLSDARHGIVNPNRLSGYHDFSGISANFKSLMDEISASETPDTMMLGAHPREAAFQVLKKELASVRARAVNFDAVTIKSGTFLKPGQVNPELENVVESIRRKLTADLREKHFDVLATDHSEGVYSPDVVDLVRDFQRSVKLKPDGIIGRNTIARMVGANPAAKIAKVVYAIERLRWHPDTLGNTHVFINQPAYRATYMKGGRPELSMRAVVGKPSNQTYFFHDKIEYVEYNPYWGIPQSILVNEMLPKLRRNAAYFDNIGYEMTNQQGSRVYSSDVDWYSIGSAFPFNVRQPPSRKNALGELKIMFPNKHSIYMHDTPAKSLFKRNARAFSHGCVRLAEPRRMAAAVLGSSVGSIASRLADGENKQQRLKRKVPVYVAYFTAWPNSSGKMDYFGDVYGRDKALAKAMAIEAKVRANARGV